MTLAAALAAAGVWIATRASQAAQMQGTTMGSTAPKTGFAVGVVTAVDAHVGTVTIQHEPIPAVGWPAMTMAFKAATPAVLKAAKVGEKIAFRGSVEGPRAEVTSIKPR